MHDHIAMTYGLNRESSLNELSYFHITEGLIPDVIHDILEGVLRLTIKNLLKYLVDAKLLTVAKINMRIARFDYSTIESSNKPCDNLTNATATWW